MSFPISAPPLDPPIRGHFYGPRKGTLSLPFNSHTASVFPGIGEELAAGQVEADAVTGRRGGGT